MGVFDTHGDSNATDTVSGVDTAALHDAVLAAVERGWLLSFGSSRDGGAVSVAVLSDEGKERIWAATPDELERVLRAVVAAADGRAGESGPEGGSSGSTAPTGPNGGKPAGQKGGKRGT